MNDTEKRRREVHAVEMLNEAKRLGLREIRRVDDDPPDVEAFLGERIIGIEVTAAIDGERRKTGSLLHTVVFPRARVLAAEAAPGEVVLGFDGANIAHLDHAGLQAFAGGIASAIVQLARYAVAEGARASSMTGQLRQRASRELPSPNRLYHHEVSLPPGVDEVSFMRTAGGGLVVGPMSWSGSLIVGPGLDTAREFTHRKANDLAKWDARFQERWLVLPCAGFFSDPSVWGARHSRERFFGTGFDCIYLLGDLDGHIDAERLDVFDES